jgi:hypothetical protein
VTNNERCNGRTDLGIDLAPGHFRYNPAMITKIGLKNFKLHSETNLDATTVTVFIGPNNSGKSSVFQSLLLWRQAAVRGDSRLCIGSVSRVPLDEDQPYVFAPDQIFDSGEFNQVSRGGRSEITLSVAGAIPSKRRIAYFPGATLGSFEVRVRENGLVYQGGIINYNAQSIAVGGEVHWRWIQGQPPQQVAVPLALGGLNANVQLQAQQNFRLLDPAGVTFTGVLPVEDSINLQEFMNELSRAPLNFLNSIHAVFPLRGFEQAGYPLAEPADSIDRIGLADRTIALLSVLAYNRQIEQRLSSWLEELVGVGIEIKLLPGKRVTLLSSAPKTGRDNPLFSGEGTGANQLPFILVPIGLTPENETVLLSEPEVHLHPRAQTTLTKLLVDLANKEKRQFFIETHSEHVLHALLHSVATGAIKREDLTIYYFERDNGTTSCKKLDVDDAGGVEGGLPGFFDQSLGELAEYLDALKRQ